MQNGRFSIFESPRLRGNIRWSYLAHWKAHSGLPISVNWTFFKIGDFAPMRADWPKISGRRCCPHQPFFFS